MTSRLEGLHIILQKSHLDGLLVSHQPNINYLTGFPSSDSYLLITKKNVFFITDSRFYQQAISFFDAAKNKLNKAEKAYGTIKGLEVELSGRSVFATIAKLAGKERLKRLGFEARNLDFAQYNRIKKLLRPSHFIPTQALVEDLRRVKEARELTKIKKAVSIAARALKYVQKIIRPGLSEIEIVAELERFIRYHGARASSFETIVASGENTAYPHHLTGKRKLKKCDCLFIDIGVDYEGYKSDLTRTFFLGRIPLEISKIYQIVLQAQIQAINKIKPGVRICEIDRSARQYIANHGYGGFFAHNLGHGIGLEVHEQPTISADNSATIEVGMVFTVEPAIYLKGRFGIRIEDDVVVTKGGCEVLSSDLDK
jgi:Xaa-Pro aminopeptidase